MSEIRICGYRPLSGEIKIQGSKNGALPMLAAAILQKGTMKFTNVPIIQDVVCMVGILESIGCQCRWDKNTLEINASHITGARILKEDMEKMRSSILVMGALLGRRGQAVTWYPGGCSIGSRPIDLHLSAFAALGARIQEEEGRMEATAPALTGAIITFPYPSVGATENALLASVLAQGETVIMGAALEPEIISLCRLLNQMGGKVEGIGTSILRIQGVKELYGTEFPVPGDRIAAGTYLIAAAATEGNVRILGAVWEDMEEVVQVLQGAGAKVERIPGGREDGGIALSMEGRPRVIKLSTRPYPGFPTDLQSPMLAWLSRGEGISQVEETVFEARFKTVRELRHMGAEIQVQGNRAEIFGIHRLKGARVKSWDLRGGAALVTAALAAQGETVISDCQYIERGYEDICRDIQALNGSIRWG